MNYEIGDIVRVVSTHGISRIHEDKTWIGGIGNITSVRGNKIYAEFDPTLEENKVIGKRYPGVRPVVRAYFGEEELEPYILDINFLD